jgi:enamine deaminase RidA (YjgF/YER057c/UK114 family)
MIATLRPLLLTSLLLSLAHQVTAAEGCRAIGLDPATRTAAAVVVEAAMPLVHTSQILPRDAQGKTIAPGRADAQAEALVGRLEPVLDRAHSGMSLLVKLNVYATNPEAIAAFKRVLAGRLPREHGPAVSFVAGALADPEALLAIDAVAAVTGSGVPAGGVTPLSMVELAGQRTPAHVAVLPPGGRVFVSGQADPGPGLKQATRRTLEGLEQTLRSMGLDRSRVVQLKAFMNPMTEAAAVEREVAAFFGRGAVPPLVLVEWRSSTPPIEIELVAAAGPATGGEPVEYRTPPALKPSPVFSRVARVNGADLIYVSGLYGPPRTSGQEQVESVLDALGALAGRAGSDLKHLVKATYYVADDASSRALNELRPRYYDPARPPAASKALVAGVGLPGRSITIDMIAVPIREGSRP